MLVAVLSSNVFTGEKLAPRPSQIPPGESQKRFAASLRARGLLRKVPWGAVTPTTTLVWPRLSMVTLSTPWRVSNWRKR